MRHNKPHTQKNVIISKFLNMHKRLLLLLVNAISTIYSNVVRVGMSSKIMYIKFKVGA